jgi:hypothetical protein
MGTKEVRPEVPNWYATGLLLFEPATETHLTACLVTQRRIACDLSLLKFTLGEVNRSIR